MKTDKCGTQTSTSLVQPTRVQPALIVKANLARYVFEIMIGCEVSVKGNRYVFNCRLEIRMKAERKQRTNNAGVSRHECIRYEHEWSSSGHDPTRVESSRFESIRLGRERRKVSNS